MNRTERVRALATWAMKNAIGNAIRMSARVTTIANWIVRNATGASTTAVEDALALSGGDAKVAIVSLLADVDASEARSRLRAADGVVRGALRP